jgi:hypothetical protein
LTRIKQEYQSSELSKKSFEAEKQRALNAVQTLKKSFQRIRSDISKVEYFFLFLISTVQFK